MLRTLTKILVSRVVAGGGGSIARILNGKLSLSVEGQYHETNEGNIATIFEEVWCDGTLYIWNWLTGRPGTNNDIYMLAVSPLKSDIRTGYFKFSKYGDY